MLLALTGDSIFASGEWMGFKWFSGNNDDSVIPAGPGDRLPGPRHRKPPAFSTAQAAAQLLSRVSYLNPRQMAARAPA